ncbi:MAG: ChaN family lipoprotein [Pseudohongiellaceae bacterium]
MNKAALIGCGTNRHPCLRWIVIGRSGACIVLALFVCLGGAPLAAQVDNDRDHYQQQAGTISPFINAPDVWYSSLYKDHPLVGRIWDNANTQYIHALELADNLGAGRFVLLGEKHDNKDHHLLQSFVLQLLDKSNPPQAVSFEMLDSTAADKLARLYSTNFTDSEALRDYLEWDVEGWDWELYGRLVWQVYRKNIPVRAGNISRAKMSEIYAGELPTEVAAVMHPEQQEKITADIDESHCGMLPESQFPAMLRVQQARDASLARSLLSTAQDGEANRVTVLIAGTYHIRQDLGVPNYLLAFAPQLNRSEIRTLAFMEVRPEEMNVAAYQEITAGQPAYDYIWFTPAATDKDYCAEL